MPNLTSILLLTTATGGPGFAVEGVASRLFGGTPAMRDPVLVDPLFAAIIGFGEETEGAMTIDEVWYVCDQVA